MYFWPWYALTTALHSTILILSVYILCIPLYQTKHVSNTSMSIAQASRVHTQLCTSCSCTCIYRHNCCREQSDMFGCCVFCSPTSGWGREMAEWAATTLGNGTLSETIEVTWWVRKLMMGKQARDSSLCFSSYTHAIANWIHPSTCSSCQVLLSYYPVSLLDHHYVHGCVLVLKSCSYLQLDNNVRLLGLRYCCAVPSCTTLASVDF